MGLDRRPFRGGALIVCLLFIGSCSAGAVVPRANRYANEVDGVTVGWPRGWQRIAAGHHSLPGSVDLVTIATFTPRPARQATCTPFGVAAVGGLGEGDALFQVRTVAHLYPERPAGPLPQSFFAHAEPAERRRGCKDGTDVRVVAFEHHKRLYEAIVWADAPLTERRQHEIETIWTNLEVKPIATGRHYAAEGRRYWHEISTHCGITDTDFDGREWVADPALVFGSEGPSPPPGWQNPSEIGTIRLEDAETAVFESRDSTRTARFRPRISQDRPRRYCD